MFDQLDLQGGFHGDATLDFLDTSFGSSILESPTQAHPATVSPTDLFNDEPVMSAPPSTAFPNLATPESEFLDSPFTSSGLNTTPMLEGALDSELDMTRLEGMPSLFPELSYDQFDVSPAIVPNSSFGSLSDLAQPSPMVRQKSSPGRPPIIHDRKASLSAGITKGNNPKVRSKDLPEITIDSEDDKETAKRKKNTAAARKSRQRKQETMSAMSAEISRLRAIIEALGADPDVEYTTT